MIDVVSGPLAKERDWNQVWLQSPENASFTKQLNDIEQDAQSKPVAYQDDGREFATPLWEQCKIVLGRNSMSLYRDTDYVNNKLILHIFSALFNGSVGWRHRAPWLTLAPQFYVLDDRRLGVGPSEQALQ
jgi:ATP-binding cassette subfamily G (WHITE) protein 2 (SNQ2)